MKMSKNSLSLDKLTGSFSNSFGPKPIANLYEFYVSGDIGPCEDYVDWFDTIRHADENDVIKIYINSFGGHLYTAIQFMRVMGECRGTIITSAEGACMSAATILFLCGDNFEVSPHCVFMFHNYSGGAFGKGGEMIDQLLHERKWSENLFRAVYKDFLNEEEIKLMLEGKDWYMDGEEVVKRLQVMKDATEAALEQQEQAEAPDAWVADVGEKPTEEEKSPRKRTARKTNR